MKNLYTVIKNELKEIENIFILRESEINKGIRIMNEYTFDEIFNIFSKKEKVKTYWHEDGLCIILKG